MNPQIQYRPVALEFITANSLTELEAKVSKALESNKLLHGDWKITPDGLVVQAVCTADWRIMPPPKLPDQPNILVPQQGPGRILG